MPPPTDRSPQPNRAVGAAADDVAAIGEQRRDGARVTVKRLCGEVWRGLLCESEGGRLSLALGKSKYVSTYIGFSVEWETMYIPLLIKT